MVIAEFLIALVTRVFLNPHVRVQMTNQIATEAKSLITVIVSAPERELTGV